MGYIDKIEELAVIFEDKRKKETETPVSDYSTGKQVAYQEVVTELCEMMGFTPYEFFNDLSEDYTKRVLRGRDESR